MNQPNIRLRTPFHLLYRSSRDMHDAEHENSRARASVFTRTDGQFDDAPQVFERGPEDPLALSLEAIRAIGRISSLRQMSRPPPFQATLAPEIIERIYALSGLAERQRHSLYGAPQVGFPLAREFFGPVSCLPLLSDANLFHQAVGNLPQTLHPCLTRPTPQAVRPNRTLDHVDLGAQKPDMSTSRNLGSGTPRTSDGLRVNAATTSRSTGRRSAVDATAVTCDAKLISQINENDVLLGRGVLVEYSGNKKYRALIRYHQRQYLEAAKGEKGQIARFIFELVKKQTPSGRFLKQVPNTRLWVEVEKQVALNKTSQALRDASFKFSKRSTSPTSSHSAGPTSDVPPSLPTCAFSATQPDESGD